MLALNRTTCIRERSVLYLPKAVSGYKVGHGPAKLRDWTSHSSRHLSTPDYISKLKYTNRTVEVHVFGNTTLRFSTVLRNLPDLSAPQITMWASSFDLVPIDPLPLFGQQISAYDVFLRFPEILQPWLSSVLVSRSWSPACRLLFRHFSIRSRNPCDFERATPTAIMSGIHRFLTRRDRNHKLNKQSKEEVLAYCRSASRFNLYEIVLDNTWGFLGIPSSVATAIPEFFQVRNQARG
jgi:hypothetical protein